MRGNGGEMATLAEYYSDLFQEVIGVADSYGIYREDAFFEIASDILIDAGEFDEAQRSYYRPERGGVRIDGYGGDPLDSYNENDSSFGTLVLISIDFNQDDKVATLTNKEMESAFKRMEKFVTLSLSKEFRESLEPTDPGAGLADLIAKRWEKINRIRMFLISNRALSNRVDGKDSEDIDGKKVVYNVWDINRIKNLVESGREREELVIDFDALPSGPIRALLASKKSSKEKVFLAAIPGDDLAAIYDKWGTRLLEQNVRVFLQARSAVNKGIKRTLENEPKLFFSFNNGITATAEAIETAENTNNGLQINRLKNLQIVNGGQTTASIYAAYKAKIDLTEVYVQMKLSIVEPEKAKELVPRISEYANSQNKVSSADFFANHEFHVRMEEFSRRILAPAKDSSFNRTKWFYERARGQYRDAQTYLSRAEKTKFLAENPKNQTFSKTDLAKYEMVWTDNGYFVNRGAQKNFSKFASIISNQWDKNKDNFNEAYFKELVAKKIIFNATEKIIPSREWYEVGGYRSQHVALALGVLYHYTKSQKKSIDFLDIWNKQNLSPALYDSIAKAADFAHEILMNPDDKYHNFSEWAKQPSCWSALANENIEWSQTWIDELISEDEVKETAKAEAKDQRILDGIQAQTLVVQAGQDFWHEALSWCLKENEGTEKERSLIKVASKSIPTEKQAVLLVQTMDKFKREGCPLSVRSPKNQRRRGHYFE